MTREVSRRLVLLVSVLGVVVERADASTWTWGDYNGSTVEFIGVNEASVTDPSPLFGAPAVAGDTLDFYPVAFASSSSGGSIDSTVGTLDFTLAAKAGSVIDELVLSEAGDVTLFGVGGSGTFAAVSAPVFVDIIEVDGVGIDPVKITANMVFSPSDGDFNLQDDGPLFGTIWGGGVSLDLEQALIDSGESFSFGATRVRVILNNILVTVSERGSGVTIQKGDQKSLAITAVTIPEPSTAFLGMSVLLLRFVRRRR